MNSDVFFSIIIPVYNTKKEYLEECLNSVLKQEYDNYEIIIVNDGSNKETSDILESYNNKLRIVNQENQGVIKARINGVSQSKGDYIVFVDSDDFISEEMLKLLNKIVQDYNSDLIMYESIKFVDDINNIIEPGHYFKEGPVTKKEAVNQLLQLHINAFSDKACKKENLISLINNIDTTIINGEDLQQSTYLILNSDYIYYTDEPISFYRIHEGERDYYDVTRVNDINFLVPTYKMVFEETNEYLDMLPIYKQAAVNAVIYTAFCIIWQNNSISKTSFYLDELSKQKTVSILKNLKHRISFYSQFIFNLIINKNYFVLIIVAKIYRVTNKLPV